MLAGLFATVAHAEPSADEERVKRAEQLFDEGKALLEEKGEKQVDAACEKLEESRNLDPAVGTLGLLGYCRELQGRTATAWRIYLQSAEMAALKEDTGRENVARERAAALEESLSRVRFAVADPPDGFVLTCAGQTISLDQWAEGIPTDPGPIEVIARAPGYRPWSVHMDLTAASVLTIRVPALERMDDAVQPESLEPALEPGEPNLIPGIAVGGAGVLFLGIGSYLGLKAMSKNNASSDHCIGNACDPAGGQLRDEAKQAAGLSTVTVGLGLVGVGVGTVLIMREMKRDDHAPQGVRIEPNVGFESAGLSLRGVF